MGMVPGTPGTRVAVGLAAAVLLGGIALVAVNRAERLTNEDVAGVYRVEPTARGNATDRMLFQRFEPGGRTWLEEVRVADTAGGLAATTSSDSARATSWSIRDGRLCIGAEDTQACSAISRDPVTGDLTVGEQRLTRLRSAVVVD